MTHVIELIYQLGTRVQGATMSHPILAVSAVFGIYALILSTRSKAGA
jgi:hypothetical protein